MSNPLIKKIQLTDGTTYDLGVRAENIENPESLANVPASMSISASGVMTFFNASGVTLFTGQLPLYNGGVV